MEGIDEPSLRIPFCETLYHMLAHDSWYMSSWR